MTHAENVILCARARKIALRLAPYPTGPAASCFDPRTRASFIADCRQIALHNRTYRAVFARLAAKAEQIVEQAA